MTIGNIMASIQFIISLTCLSQGKAKDCVTVTADNVNCTEKIKLISGTNTEKQTSFSFLLPFTTIELFIFRFEGTGKMRSDVEHHHGHERQLKQRVAPQKLTDR